MAAFLGRSYMDFMIKVLEAGSPRKREVASASLVEWTIPESLFVGVLKSLGSGAESLPRIE